MQINQLVSDERAVPPVIGVILMVAITVILAAVTATFVLGIGNNTSVAPSASFSFDYNPEIDTDGEVKIIHNGGDNIRYDELYIRGEKIDADNETDWKTLVDDGQASVSGSIEGTSAAVSGDSAKIGVNGDDYTIRVVWQSSNGGTSSELAVDRGPNAG